VFVLESGPASAPVVLFVHALGLDHSMWASQQAALDNELRLVMPDLPGFGRSRLEESGLDRCVEACAERLAHGGRPATVAGVSYGGWVGAMLAAKHPDLVSGLAISGVRPEIPRYLAELQAIAFRMTPTRELRRGDRVAMSDLKTERANLIAAARELAAVDLMSSLKRITVPTVVFAPSRDRLVRRQAPLVAAAAGDAQLIPLAGAGHLWPVKQPTPLTERIRALASLDRNEQL
jgi:pimeloyl-ACP methyl ester carboxylesterase